MVSNSGLLGLQNGDKRSFQSPDLLEICRVFKSVLLGSLPLVSAVLRFSPESTGLQSCWADREAVTGGPSGEERGQLERSLHSGGGWRSRDRMNREIGRTLGECSFTEGF